MGYSLLRRVLNPSVQQRQKREASRSISRPERERPRSFAMSGSHAASSKISVKTNVGASVAASIKPSGVGRAARCYDVELRKVVLEHDGENVANGFARVDIENGLVHGFFSPPTDVGFPGSTVIGH